MVKRAKASRTYQDSSDDDIEILGSTQGRSAPGIYYSTASPRHTKRSAVASSARRHRYNYRDGSDAEDDKKDSVASPPADNNDDDLSDVKAV